MDYQASAQARTSDGTEDKKLSFHVFLIFKSFWKDPLHNTPHHRYQSKGLFLKFLHFEKFLSHRTDGFHLLLGSAPSFSLLALRLDQI